MSKLDKPDPMELDSDREAQDADDPITATYPVFLNPSLPAGRRLLVLQHPNRTDDLPRPPPTELRLKSRAGMVEVDIPVDSSQNVYDREKGQRWGRSLHASTAAKSGGSHGLAGGFGFGAVQQRAAGGGRKKSEGLDNEDDVMMDWNEAVRQGKALTTQTFGGQYPDTSDVQYMVGVFQGKNLHLTPAASMVHLRPQLHHIDATAHLERRTAESGAGGAGGGGSGGGGSAGQAAKAIHMTIKNTADGDAVTTETMADRLRAVQSEPWRKMRYTDENEEAAWEVYNESLFLRDQDAPEKPPVKEGEEEEEKKAEMHDDLEETMAHFSTKWGDKELLEAVSGIRKEEPQPQPEVKPDPEPKPAPKAAPKAEAAPAARKATRTRGGGTGARRGGRA